MSIVDTAADTLPHSLYTDTANPPRAKWLAHNNTIFDLAWAKVRTASRAAVWPPLCAVGRGLPNLQGDLPQRSWQPDVPMLLSS